MIELRDPVVLPYNSVRMGWMAFLIYLIRHLFAHRREEAEGTCLQKA